MVETLLRRIDTIMWEKRYNGIGIYAMYENTVTGELITITHVNNHWVLCSGYKLISSWNTPKEAELAATKYMQNRP